MYVDPVKLEIYKHLFVAIADEMGTILRKTSYSPNIKERRDYSCALFDTKNNMIAQAAHIPVHLGAMRLSVQEAVNIFNSNILAGDIIILNDPYHGGTHLPDITMISPVFIRVSSESNNEELVAYVASRAHHSDMGGISPGSMPLAQEIFQEGLIIPPIKLVQAGKLDEGLINFILANVRTPDERKADLFAQIAANQRGVDRTIELFNRYGREEITQAMEQLLTYTDLITRRFIQKLPEGCYTFSDILDDDGFSSASIEIKVKITIKGDHAIVDFTGSAPQQQGGINAVLAITYSAVSYVFRCLLGLDVPNNSGCLMPIDIIAPPGTIVNAQFPAAVAGGNVETSQRIVDVLLGALAQACPEIIPAASQGTMNNISIGGFFPKPDIVSETGILKPFVYYETIGGGSGARPTSNGLSSIHSHMTNTLNTPVEALEYNYPIQIKQYSVRKGSGGIGKFNGGDGIIREMVMLTACQITLLTERRSHPPYGLAGGNPGECGKNMYIRNGIEYHLPSKGSFNLLAGDILKIYTPGGGGYGSSTKN